MFNRLSLFLLLQLEQFVFDLFRFAANVECDAWSAQVDLFFDHYNGDEFWLLDNITPLNLEDVRLNLNIASSNLTNRHV